MLTALATVAALAAGPSYGDTPQYKPCPTEDSVSCVWRANVRGNREGRSFVAGNDGPNGDGDQDGRITFVSHKLARALVKHDHWRRVPWRLVGETADTVDQDPDSPEAKTITRLTVWSVGDTTYFIWPHSARVASS